MSRLKIPKQENIHFTTNLSVQVNHLNYGGHLGNDQVLTICHEARCLFYESFGYQEMNIEGYGTLMVDAAIQFINQAFRGDVLTIAISAHAFTPCRFELYYSLQKEKEIDIARVNTGIVCFDYQNQELVKIPEAFQKTFDS